MKLIELRPGHYKAVNKHNRVVAFITLDSWTDTWHAFQPGTFKLLASDSRKDALFIKIEAMDL